MNQLFARCGLILAGLLCWAAAVEIWRLDPRRSGLALAAFAVSLIAGAGLIALSAASKQRKALYSSLLAFGNRAAAAKKLHSPWLGGLLIITSFGGYLLLASWFIPLHKRYFDNDQGAYLRIAGELNDAGGPPVLLRDLYSGRFDETNQHPLFPALLSFNPNLHSGKVLSTIIGAIAMAIVVILVARRFDLLTAGVFAILLATNFAWCFATTVIACEGLLMLWCGLVWLCSTPPPGGAMGKWRCALMGALLGLAYVTKGTAPLFLMGYLVWLAVGCRLGPLSRPNPLRCGRNRLRRDNGPIPQPGPKSKPHRRARPSIWRRVLSQWAVLICVLLGFVIAASPLLVRNMRRFGNPLYNVNTYLLFWDEGVDPVELQQRMSIGEAAGEYFRTHSLREMASREAKGLIWETFILLRSLGPSPLDDSRVLFGIPLLVLSFLGMWTERRPDALLLIIWLVICMPLFAWYIPIAAGQRFLLPLLIPLLVYSACGILRLAALFWPSKSVRFGPSAVFIAALFWLLGAVAATFFMLPMEGRFN